LGEQCSIYGCRRINTFANDFVEKFPNAELVLVGAGDEEMGNAHAPNESVQIEDIENLIKSLIKTLKDFS